MKNYKISRLFLKNVQYNFTMPDKKDIAISINDVIKIIEINGNEALLEVGRNLCFGPKTESFVKTNYEVVIECNENIEKQELFDALNNKNINLTVVYSKTSLLISQITNMSPFGVIVTSPNYEVQKVNIK